MNSNLNVLRKEIRLKRKKVNRFEHKKNEQQILNRLRSSSQFKSAKKVGLYLHAFGEIHTKKLRSEGLLDKDVDLNAIAKITKNYTGA